MALPTAPQRDSAGQSSADFEKDRDLLRAILSSAVTHGASDIHIRAEAQPVLRVSGDLWPLEMDPLTPEQAESMVLAAMDSEREREEFLTVHECDFALADPGVGRFRVNAYRARGGAAMVLRHVKEDIPSIEDLGLPPVVKDLALRASGLILVSGPTGSGKTTSLAAMIDVINSERRCHILTIEDPIEFMHNGKLATVSQREVNTDTLDFERALRSGMRQDPDVIFVGEIRDAETVDIVIRSALTGHLVFSTLHTNDAISSVGRMIDMGAEPYLVASVLEGLLAQRLGRRICTHCKTRVPMPEDLRHRLPPEETDRLEGMMYVGTGCEKCSNTGFRGRLGFYELIRISPTLRAGISEGRSLMELRTMLGEDFVTMREDGIRKAIDGLTTPEEVLRATQDVDDFGA